MSRYESDEYEDRSGFEDPRFAGGRRPDDDNERAFGGSFGTGSDRGGGSRFGCGCLLTVLGFGAAFVVVCCGGLAWFTMNVESDRIEAALTTDPALRGQLEEVLGPGYDLQPDPAGSLQAPAGTYLFEAVGPRGSGRLRVVSGRDRTVAPPAVTVTSAVLEMQDGQVHELTVLGPPPALDGPEDPAFDDPAFDDVAPGDDAFDEVPSNNGAPFDR